MATTEKVITSLPASGSNVNKAQLPDNALVLPPTAQLQALLTIIRDEKTQRYVGGLSHLMMQLTQQGRLCLVSLPLQLEHWSS
jgi:uracil phosphoribosyltransferase